MPAAAAPHSTAEGLVRRVHDIVTFPAGSTVDLDALRGTFLPGAVLVLRTSRARSTVMSVDDGHWWIAGVLNELPTPERPVPDALRGVR